MMIPRLHLPRLLPALLLAAGVAMADLPTDLPSGTGPQAQPGISGPDVVSDWVKELSNMPKESRSAYAEAFKQAKSCYAQGRLVECETHLNTCELYTRSNPNVWNLRASVLISQQRYTEAEPLLLEVRRFNPQDSVCRLSFSLLYLGSGRYEQSIEETDQLIDDIKYKDMMQLTHSLMFRKLLSLVMLGRMDDARAVVAEISPIDDSPLYYYSQGVFALVEGNRRQAMREFNTADAIYASMGYLNGYKQALNCSGLTEKYTVTPAQK